MRGEHVAKRGEKLRVWEDSVEGRGGKRGMKGRGTRESLAVRGISR